MLSSRWSAAAAMSFTSSLTHADDRLPLASLGRFEGGNGTVEGRDVADVRTQPPVTHPPHDLTQLGAVGLDDEVDRKTVRGPRHRRPDDGHQRSSGANETRGALLDVAQVDGHDNSVATKPDARTCTRDIVYGGFRLGPLDERHPGRTRSLIRHHDRFHLGTSSVSVLADTTSSVHRCQRRETSACSAFQVSATTRHHRRPALAEQRRIGQHARVRSVAEGSSVWRVRVDLFARGKLARATW
jgi:hypothetical protein